MGQIFESTLDWTERCLNALEEIRTSSMSSGNTAPQLAGIKFSAITFHCTVAVIFLLVLFALCASIVCYPLQIVKEHQVYVTCNELVFF